MTRMDDFPSYDEPRPSRGGGFGWRRYLVVVCGCAAAGYVFKLGLGALRFGVSFPLASTVALALAGLIGIIRRLGSLTMPPIMLVPLAESQAADPLIGDGIRDKVKRWQTRLDWGGESAARFAAVAQPTMVELIDERLAVRHGVNRLGNPERARELLGPELWKFVNEPVSHRPTARDLTRLVAAMEAL